jgi:DNA-binding NtrC family response regulator
MIRPRILIVDDNLDLAENLAEIIHDAGYDATVFSDPRAAVERAVAGEYALALLDMRMPHMDGIELLRHLKKLDPALPAIAMTAYSQDALVEAAVREGVTMVVPKPLDLRWLLARLLSAIAGRRVLIVEDDVDLAQNLAEMFSAAGLSSHVAHTAAQARHLAAALNPVVLVVDLRLPDGSGADLVEELGQACPECIRVLISGYPRDLETLPRTAGAGGWSFFEKPLDLPALLAAVATYKRTAL